jgi:septal ring factor EnvC (AmiA/AmiB activator)
MSELDMLADCLKDATKERDDLAAALEQSQSENKRLTKQLADVASYEGAAQRKRIEKLEGELDIKLASDA